MAKNKVKKKKQRKHPKFWFGFKIFILLFLVTLLVAGILCKIWEGYFCCPGSGDPAGEKFYTGDLPQL